jgi:diketogulonate reductase-like aldo/keto reductase
MDDLTVIFEEQRTHPRGVIEGGRKSRPTICSAGQHLQDPVIGDIAKAHDKTPAQVMLRWHQQSRSVIPKSTKPQRIAENIDVFDFDLSPDELAAIDALDTGQRGGPEPESITLEDYGRPIPED